MSFEQNARELGIEIPEAPEPVAAYVPGVLVDGYIYTSGQLPFANGELIYKGKVGAEVSADDGYEAAKICVINCLGVVKSLVGSLDKIEINEVMAMSVLKDLVASLRLMVLRTLGKIFGGINARSAVGVVNTTDAAVEVELIVKVIS